MNFPLYRTQFPDNTTHGLVIHQADGSDICMFNDWRISYTFDGAIGWIDEFVCGKPATVYPGSSIMSISFREKR